MRPSEVFTTRMIKRLTKRTWFPGLALSSFFLFILVVLGACRKPEQKPELVVARVGAEVLTVADVATDIPSSLRQHLGRTEVEDYVVRWIDSQILYQEARKRQLDQTAALKRELRRLERELAVNALLDQELNKTFAVSAQEIEKYYNDNQQTFARNLSEVHVQFIKVNAKKTADSLTAALRAGGDFLQAARLYARGDSSAPDLFLTEEETPPAVVSAVFTIMTGAVSRPVQLDNGFHVFKMLEKFEAGTIKPLARVRAEIVAKLQSDKRQERYKQLLAQLKSSTPVEKNFQLLENISGDSLNAGGGEE